MIYLTKVKEIMENVQENSAGINDDVSLFSQILKSWDRAIRKEQKSNLINQFQS